MRAVAKRKSPEPETPDIPIITIGSDVYLSHRALEEKLRISPRQLIAWHADGYLPPAVMLGRKPYWLEESHPRVDGRRMQESQRQGSSRPPAEIMTPLARRFSIRQRRARATFNVFLFASGVLVKKREREVEVLTMTEVAKRLRVTVQTAYVLGRAGHLPVVHFGRTVRVNRRAFEQMLEAR